MSATDPASGSSETSTPSEGPEFGLIPDEELPEDVRPHEDNPLAQDPDPDAEPGSAPGMKPADGAADAGPGAMPPG